MPVASTVAWAGQSSPGAAVQFGSRSSRALNLTTGLRIFHSSSRSRKSASTSVSASRPAIRFGSALQITVPARSSVPSSSVTPSPGVIRDTGTPQASTAPYSAAASAIANEHIPMPPST